MVQTILFPTSFINTTKRTFLIPFFILLIFNCAAQNQKIKFGSINQIGLLSGSKAEAFMAQTINGIKKDKWFAGAGVGLDLYNERTIPLFLDVRKDIGNKINKPFIYADAGVNFTWLHFVQREEKQFPKTVPGLYYDFGVGWKLAGKNNRGFIVSAGYNFKQVKENVKTTIWDIISESPVETYDRYNYLYRRIVMKIGFVL